MNERVAANLGPPDLSLAGFQLWVHGYQYPATDDEWDSNSLRVTAHCGATGASVWANGAILETVGVQRFADELRALDETLRGGATLESYEPNLSVRVVAAADGAGHISVRVELTPDHMRQKHVFTFDIDQSYLTSTLSQCRALLQRFPVRGTGRQLSNDR